MQAGKLVDGFEVDENSPLPDCKPCIQAKQTCTLFSRQAMTCARNLGELTHTDLWELRVISPGGLKYFMSFMDDCSRYVTVKFLQMKGQAAEKLKAYVAYLECQYDYKPKAFRADNGGKYVSNDLVN